ncbi:hypothetical protein PU02_1259 [Bartonella ancashensis]|uniref:Uncharacterized protein n=1 Tax=Bartonella ancashensis TaxID=1318743 RepID=A0A0M5L1C3_9HYPH|nr:hypothetical protein PU02_1259 [Bartonella ancashensis]
MNVTKEFIEGVIGIIFAHADGTNNKLRFSKSFENKSSM